MKTPVHLVGIIGSLRHQSSNRAVFEAAVELVPDHVELTEASLADVPLYNGDVENAGDPAAVTTLKQATATADGLIIFTPEYNRSVPAVTKNAVDWLSRPPGESVLGPAVVGIVAATPGRHPAAGVRGHLATSVAAITDHLHEPSLGIGSVTGMLEQGRLADLAAREQLGVWLAGFVDYATTVRDDG